MHIPFILRNLTKEDENFIYNSYLKSFHSYYPMKFVPDILYFKPQSECLDFLLDTATCLVACFPEDPDEIIGYCIYQNVTEALVLHYIYIKRQHRDKGMAADIIRQIIGDNTMIIASHICDDYSKLKHTIPNCKVIYDPFLIDKLRDLEAS